MVVEVGGFRTLGLRGDSVSSRNSFTPDTTGPDINGSDPEPHYFDPYGGGGGAETHRETGRHVEVRSGKERDPEGPSRPLRDVPRSFWITDGRGDTGAGTRSRPVPSGLWNGTRNVFH